MTGAASWPGIFHLRIIPAEIIKAKSAALSAGAEYKLCLTKGLPES